MKTGKQKEITHARQLQTERARTSEEVGERERGRAGLWVGPTAGTDARSVSLLQPNEAPYVCAPVSLTTHRPVVHEGILHRFPGEVLFELQNALPTHVRTHVRCLCVHVCTRCARV